MLIISFKINQETVTEDSVWKRVWRKYSKSEHCWRLAAQDWDFTSDSVQDYWNELENQLITVIDGLVPVQIFYLMGKVLSLDRSLSRIKDN